MKNTFENIVKAVLVLGSLSLPAILFAQTKLQPPSSALHSQHILLLAIFITGCLLAAAVFLLYRTKQIRNQYIKKKEVKDSAHFKKYVESLDSNEIEEIISTQKHNHNSLFSNSKDITSLSKKLHCILLLILLLSSAIAFAQSPNAKPLATEPGIIITVILISIPILAGIILMIAKLSNLLKNKRNKDNLAEAEEFASYLKKLSNEETILALAKRKASLDYHLTNVELSGRYIAIDEKGLVSNVNFHTSLPFVATKKKAQKRPDINPQLAKLICWYIGSATFWLVFGTTVGEYLGIKFVAPDADHISWLSFGRLRPVHTNAVFWGWSSLAMLGLGYYIVPMVSNAAIASIKKGWYTLVLINAAVILGSLCLMAGINNAGGEYREYIWPVMTLFGAGLIVTLINFIQTIAKRTTKEIYISNWYIVAAIIFVLVITVVAYVPFWQDGLGETIIQGYYMHQGVGMWFMLFTLGIVYYFLPQQLNKPIYSYSLGILAFWTQILFYTVIGTHHFVFSSIPWWLQTIAIVGSVGMIIPVAAGFTNFIMTFKGAWYKVAGSYTLPFFLTGIIFYLTGSMQGTAEAFRSTNLIWHFTDFTVAHSHLTMYGIIAFFAWAGIYAVLPRLTGKEPPQILIGAHFWLALAGLLFYTVPLMYGSTLKGLMWVQGKPFIDGVVFMAPYWLWRAIGGSFMWISHLIFAYNIYKMMSGNNLVDVKKAAIEKLKQQNILNFETT
jgi:cytochrome c oxidase cbb3-type subunit I